MLDFPKAIHIKLILKQHSKDYNIFLYSFSECTDSEHNMENQELLKNLKLDVDIRYSVDQTTGKESSIVHARKLVK